MAGGNGQRGTKRTRHHADQQQQQEQAQQPQPPMPPPAHHPMAMAAMPQPMQHPYLPPPPPPGAAMPGAAMLPPPPPPGMMAAAWGYMYPATMPPPPGTLPLPPPGYPTAVAPTPARPAPAGAAAGAAGAANAVARQVSPAIADRPPRGGATTGTAPTSTNKATSPNKATSTTTPPAVPTHLRAAYRTQPHACPSCAVASPSATYATHPGPQHRPSCPRHRPPAMYATATAQLQAALTREWRTIKQRIEDDIAKQRGDVLKKLERSRQWQLEMALADHRAAQEALGRVPGVAAMNGGERMGGQVAPQVPPAIPLQMGMMQPIPPPPPAMQQRHPKPPPPQDPAQLEETGEWHETAGSSTPQPNHQPPVEDDLPPQEDDEEDDLLEPLPAAELTAHMPEPMHAATEVGTSNLEDAAAAVEAVDELIAEAGLDGDEEMAGLNGGHGLLLGGEGAAPQCVQHLVRSKKRRGSSSGATGAGAGMGGSTSKRTGTPGPATAASATEAVKGATSPTTEMPAPTTRPSLPPPATTTLTTPATTTLPPHPTPIGLKCTHCQSFLVGGPPAAMCTSDKCRTMLCGTCLDEHRATAPDHSWCSDCGRVVNIVCRTCLRGQNGAACAASAATSGTRSAGRTKLGSNEFLRCRAANCERYCCPRHLRMMDCTVCGRQPFCHGPTRKCSTEGCEDCGRELCGQMLCALKEGCICGKRRHDPNVDWAITIMGEARAQQTARAALEAAEEEEDPVENVPAQRKQRRGRGKKSNEAVPPAGHTDVLQANIHRIHDILTGGDNSNSNEMASI